MEKLVVGCVVCIPMIVFLLAASWQNWHGKWLGLAGGYSFAPGEGPESPYRRRRARRFALVFLVWVAAWAGMLATLALDALGGFRLSTGLPWGMALLAILAGSGTWLAVTSRRDGAAVAAAASGSGPGLVEDYELDARRLAILAVAMLAILVLEIGGSFLAPW